MIWRFKAAVARITRPRSAGWVGWRSGDEGTS